mmetsp:Transcript_40758/g.101247  ORF Transcript_40758/g.101247 Transcript_40758/m.101247 type:complete len:275 (+) Transcript_40758:1608-2432(+)
MRLLRLRREGATRHLEDVVQRLRREEARRLAALLQVLLLLVQVRLQPQPRVRPQRVLPPLARGQHRPHRLRRAGEHAVHRRLLPRARHLAVPRRTRREGEARPPPHAAVRVAFPLARERILVERHAAAEAGGAPPLLRLAAALPRVVESPGAEEEPHAAEERGGRRLVRRGEAAGGREGGVGVERGGESLREGEGRAVARRRLRQAERDRRGVQLLEQRALLLAERTRRSAARLLEHLLRCRAVRQVQPLPQLAQLEVERRLEYLGGFVWPRVH